jgi:hypothetical protein
MIGFLKNLTIFNLIIGFHFSNSPLLSSNFNSVKLSKISFSHSFSPFISSQPLISSITQSCFKQNLDSIIRFHGDILNFREDYLIVQRMIIEASITFTDCYFHSQKKDIEYVVASNLQASITFEKCYVESNYCCRISEGNTEIKFSKCTFQQMYSVGVMYSNCHFIFEQCSILGSREDSRHIFRVPTSPSRIEFNNFTSINEEMIFYAHSALPQGIRNNIFHDVTTLSNFFAFSMLEQIEISNFIFKDINSGRSIFPKCAALKKYIFEHIIVLSSNFGKFVDDPLEDRLTNVYMKNCYLDLKPETLFSSNLIFQFENTIIPSICQNYQPINSYMSFLTHEICQSSSLSQDFQTISFDNSIIPKKLQTRKYTFVMIQNITEEVVQKF